MGHGRKWVGNIREGDRTWETPNSGKWTRVVEGEVGGRMGWLGDGHWGGGTWRDEHWVLYYMLANRTPIKKICKKKKKKKERKGGHGSGTPVVQGRIGHCYSIIAVQADTCMAVQELYFLVPQGMSQIWKHDSQMEQLWKIWLKSLIYHRSQYLL